MFKNRKKSGGKRHEDIRDRDNSGVLGQYDTEASPSPMPVRRESLTPGHFHYLKLTDGFNFVLTPDSGSSQPQGHDDQPQADPPERTESEQVFASHSEGGQCPAGPEAVMALSIDEPSPSSLSDSRQGQPPELAVAPQTSGCKDESPSSAPRTHTPDTPTTADPSAGHTTGEGDSGQVPKGQQHVVSGVTTTREVKGGRNETSKATEAAYKQPSVDSSRRGASDKRAVLTAKSAHAVTSQSSYDNAPTAEERRESAPAPGLLEGAGDDDEEHNTARQQPVWRRRSPSPQYHDSKDSIHATRHALKPSSAENSPAPFRPVFGQKAVSGTETRASAYVAATADDRESGGGGKAHFRLHPAGWGKKGTSLDISEDPSQASKRHTVADMFRMNRHGPGPKPDPAEKPSVYRKLQDPGLEHEETAPADPPPKVTPLGSRAAESADPGSQPATPDTPELPPHPVPPTPKPKPRKTPVYENWTTNQAFTRVMDTTLDDDEEDDGDVTDCDVMSASTQGSKDSGLCEDVGSVPEGAPGVAPAAQPAADAERSGHGDSKLSDTATLHENESDIYENTELHVPTGEDSSEGADSPHIPARHSQHHGHQSTSGDSSFDEDEGQRYGGHPEAEAHAVENVHKMRQLLVTGVLDTEKTYLAILELLLHYKRTLEASCRTSQPVISEEDIQHIFSNLQDLRDVHRTFVEGLQARLNAWTNDQTVGPVFLALVQEFPKFGAYAENYQTAVSVIHKCSQDNHRFQELAQQIVLTSTTREVTSLEDALFKPVQRLQRNTLVLYDLIKHTPQGHGDEETLHAALQLSQRNLENFGTSIVPRGKADQRSELVKSSFLVELVGASRKLRYVFVFADLLVCTKREQEGRGGNVTHDCKWFIPISELQLDTKFSYQDDNKFSKRDEIEEVKRKLRSIKAEIKKELKKDEKQRPSSSLMPSRAVEKLQRKANELEGQLIVSSPRLPFKVWHDAGKAHTFLMTTDYEREEWRELLASLKKNTSSDLSAPLSSFEVQDMLDTVRGLPEINEIGSTLVEPEDEMVYGMLNVTVHKLLGLQEACATYCCLEIDSFGHFFMKARTHMSAVTAEPSWNDDFELDVDGSGTLRVLCFRKGDNRQGDELLCRGALELSKGGLKGTYEEKIVTMNEYSLVLSVCYTATERSLRRTPVRQGGSAVFGVPLATCASREGRTVPAIITACVQEVEKRGMEETGIYRVSGVTSDVQRLKKQFDKNLRVGGSLGEVDIHTVTSLLKLYLRELPDPVFTEASYPNFLDALKLNDKEGKEKCMLSLFYKLPDINYYTAVYLLEHLLRVVRHEDHNKMGVHNLSTIFGPTMLAPAPDKLAISITDLMTQGAEHCMKQSQVIYYYLTLLTKGVSLRRSSAVIT